MMVDANLAGTAPDRSKLFPSGEGLKLSARVMGASLDDHSGAES